MVDESMTEYSFAMSLATAELPTDPAELYAFALACQSELKVAELSVQYKALEIEKLKLQIAKLRRMQFGRSSERITRQIEQLELRLEELQAGEAEVAAKADADADAAEPVGPIRERRKPKRQPLPDHLPRQEVVHQPADDGACKCPDCGKGMAKLGEDVTEVLDYVPGHFQVIRHVRPKMPAPRAMPLPRRRPRRCRRRADAPPPPRWRICWCRNTATTFRYIANVALNICDKMLRTGLCCGGPRFSLRERLSAAVSAT